MHVDNPKIFVSVQGISDQFYEMLKNEIVSNTRQPGERLLEVGLGEQYGISRTPIREALRRLEQDGLVERIPQGGVQVTPISLKMMREVFGIRAVLEAYAAELACDKVTQEDISRLRQVIARAEEAAISANLRESAMLNTAFHDMICTIPQNLTLLKAASTYGTLVLRFRTLSLHDRRFLKETWGEHILITDALEMGDKTKVADLVRRHILKGADAAERLCGDSVSE
jgi:DNA-binding GntR family transcriptional regulator